MRPSVRLEQRRPRHAAVVVIAGTRPGHRLPRAGTRLPSWHLVKAARELEQRVTLVGGVPRNGGELAGDAHVRMPGRMRRSVRRRQDAEGRDLDQDHFRGRQRIIGASRTCRQHHVRERGAVGIAHEPASSTRGCLVFVAGANPIHDRTEPAGVRRRDKRVETSTAQSKSHGSIPPLTAPPITP